MTIRILLWDVPELFAEIVANAIRDDQELEIVGSPGDEPDLASAVRRHAPDVVIAQTSDGPPGVTRPDFLNAYPLPRFIGVQTEGRDGYSFNLRLEPVPLGEISTKRLVEAIRAPVRWH